MSDLKTLPTLAWIDIEKLVVDERYQRPTVSKASEKNIAYITEHFCWASCGALTVAETDGGMYAVIDGQHRLLATKARGDIPNMPCLVIARMTMQGQAVSFSAINSKRVTLHGLGQYHAAVAAGDPDAVALAALLANAGVEIPKSPVMGQTTSPHQTQAVGSLVKLMKTNTEAHLLLSLRAIPLAYGEKKGMMRAMLIKAVVGFLSTRGKDVETTEERLVLALQRIDPVELEVNAAAAVKLQGGTVLELMVTAITREYAKASGGVARAVGKHFSPLAPASADRSCKSLTPQQEHGLEKELEAALDGHGGTFEHLQPLLGKRLVKTVVKGREVWWLDDSICTIQQAMEAARKAGMPR